MQAIWAAILLAFSIVTSVNALVTPTAPRPDFPRPALRHNPIAVTRLDAPIINAPRSTINRPHRRDHAPQPGVIDVVHPESHPQIILVVRLSGANSPEYVDGTAMYPGYFAMKWGLDPMGTYHGGDHRTITGTAFWLAISELGTDMPYDCLANMEDLLERSNTRQDRDHLGDSPRHYNRNRNGDAGRADEDYGRYLEEEMREFYSWINAESPTNSDCSFSLDSLGLLLHSWQDFYAHSMPRSAWTDGVDGNPNPNPNNRSGMHPSDWAWWSTGTEHPGWGVEPIDNDSLEGLRRWNAAVSFSKEKIKAMLPHWYAKCQCQCEEMNTRVR